MRLSASSILRISLRSRSRVRSSRLNSSSWVARSFGSGKLAASSFMCETVRSTSSMRSCFQLSRMLRKCSSCSLLMYSSPRLAMYGWTLRGPASRLPGSAASASSPSPAAGGIVRPTREVAALGGRGAGRSGLRSCAGSAAAGAALRRGAGAAPLRACVATARARLASPLRATTFLTGDRLAAFLPLADFGAGLLAGINDSYRQHQPFEERAIIPADPGVYRLFGRTLAPASDGAGLAEDLMVRSREPAPLVAASSLACVLRQGKRLSRTPLALSALDDNRGMDSAAHIEACAEAQEARVQRRVEMVGNLVGHGLMERAALAERPDVQLQRLELHAQLVGHVLDIERGEVRLPGARAQAGELGDLHANRVVARGRRVGERLERLGGRRGH